MDRTPDNNKKSKLMCRRRNSADSCTGLESTPTQFKRNTINESSPVYLPSTQEVLEDLDVVWDWNSPHLSKNKAQKSKKSFSSGALKQVPIKRHASNNQIQTFDKLKSNLEALRNQLNCESESKNDTDFNLFLKPLENDANLETLFEDSAFEEEQLLLCSQKVEEILGMQVQKHSVKGKKLNFEPKKASCKNDSFTSALETFKDEDLDLLTQAVDVKEVERKKLEAQTKLEMKTKLDLEEIKRKRLEALAKLEMKKTKQQQKPSPTPNLQADVPINHFNLNEIKKKKIEALAKPEMQQQKAFPTNTEALAKLEIKKSQQPTNAELDALISQSNLDEIKKKRMEALAKLDSKKKQQQQQKKSPTKVEVNVLLNETSPIKCSPEEIEQKRLQALAKLELKKKQEVIEKNRRDALKRLEMNKKKRTMNSQLALISRTHSR